MSEFKFTDQDFYLNGARCRPVAHTTHSSRCSTVSNVTSSSRAMAPACTHPHPAKSPMRKANEYFRNGRGQGNIRDTRACTPFGRH